MSVAQDGEPKRAWCDERVQVLADTYVKLDVETNPMSLSPRLAMTPCGPLCKRHVSPDRELGALVLSILDM
jgi:hypothetical protein